MTSISVSPMMPVFTAWNSATPFLTRKTPSFSSPFLSLRGVAGAGRRRRPARLPGSTTLPSAFTSRTTTAWMGTASTPPCGRS